MSYTPEEFKGFRMFEVVMSRDDESDEWEPGVIIGFYKGSNDSEPLKVLTEGEDYGEWRSIENTRHVTTREALTQVQVRVDTAGPAFARTTGKWQTAQLGAVETQITIKPCAHPQTVVIRHAIPRTEAEILAEVRAKYTTVNRLELGKILKGEF